MADTTDINTVYLAGPMRGYDQFNFPAFFAAEKALAEFGYTVVSPARRDLEAFPDFDYQSNTLAGFDIRNAFQWDLEQVVQCDAVMLLPGWRGSQGTLAEIAVAFVVGTPVYALADDYRRWYEILSFDVSQSWPQQNTLVAFNGDGEDVLDEAKRLTSGDRQNAYGPPDQDFARTATIWSAILGVDVRPADVALCMIALKISRASWQPKRDNWVDIAGYARCGWMCEAVAKPG